MAVFMSYARQDRAAVDALRRDIEFAHRETWIDGSLTGGQAWWDTILSQIRDSELFVFALSPSSLRSNPCMAELHYAMSVRRPVLPVCVRDVDPHLMPRELGNAHVVDFRSRSAENAISLVNALHAWAPPGPPLPDPLPAPPPVPVEYLDGVRKQIDGSSLTFDDQERLFRDLRRRLADEDQAATARTLLMSLRRRPDIGESVGREIDALLRPPEAKHDGRGPAPWAPVGGGGAGQGWAGRRPEASRQPPAAHYRAPLVPRPEPRAFNAGAFAALVLATVVIPLVGLIVGLVNFRYAARRGQSWALIGVFAIMTVLWFALVSWASTYSEPYEPTYDPYGY